MKPEAILSSLTPKQQLALPLILSGMSSLDVSKKVGVKASTVSEWLHHSESFRAAVASLRRETVERTTASIESLVLLTLDEIARILSTSKSDAVRIKACELVLSKLLISARENPKEANRTPASINLPMILKGLGYD